MNITKALVTLDSTGSIWKLIVTDILAQKAHIIALRGAGSFNGISVSDAHRLVDGELVPRIEGYLRDGEVSVIYDGDNDDPAYPDIGYIMGRLRDRFLTQIQCYAVQVWGWYRYRDLPHPLALHSINGNEYDTVIFPDKTFPGDHDHFSQSEELCRLPQYEQWYIGACGEIASKQLADYSRKVSGVPGKHKAIIFKAAVSAAQGTKIRKKLEETTDAEKAKRLQDSLARREANPFGLLCTPNGEFISKPEYGNLDIEVI